MAVYTLTASQLRGAGILNSFIIPSSSTPPTPTFDADAQAFITAAAITDPTQQTAINTLVVSMKGYGIWTKMNAIYPFVGGTASQHKFNLKDPRDLDAAFRLVFNGGWVHNSNGITGNKTNTFADTKLAYSTLNSGHLSIYSRSNIEEAGIVFDMGCQNTGGRNQVISLYTSIDLVISGINSDTYPRFAMTDSSGLFLTNRTTSTATNLWRNGSKLIQSTVAVAGTPNLSIYLGAYQIPAGASGFSSKNYAFSAIGDGLTDTEAANYYTAVQAFQTTLGRHVGVPIVSDSDAQAFLNAAVITDSTQATAVNTLVTDLKGYGIWTKMKALYPFVGGTATTHKFNLKNPLDTDAAFRLAFFGGVTHSANGVQGNETNGYYKTFINPSVVFSPASGGSEFCYSRLDINTGADLGAFAFSPTLSRFYFNPRSGFNFQAGCLSFNYVDFLNDTYSSKGFFGITREPNAPNYYSIINANSYASPNDAYQEPNAIINGLGLIADNGQALAWSNRQHAMTCIADGLTLAEVQNLRIANLAFQTTLGRQV